MDSKSEPTTINITILISGSGTNLQALIDATSTASKTNPNLSNCRITHVISNKKDAFGLTRAQRANIPTTYHNLIAGGYTRKYPNPQSESTNITSDSQSGVPASKSISKSPSKEAREAYDADLAHLILHPSDPSTIPIPDLIICAGWMHVLSPTFLSPFSTTSANIPIINLHPALPGAYNGAGAIQRAFADCSAGKTTKTGVMVHYVIDEVDMGEPIEVEEVEMREGETLGELEGWIHEVEHGIIVRGAGRVVERLIGEKKQKMREKRVE